MATAYNNDPCAIKIVDINDGLFLKVESLRDVLLRDDIKDKRVCVISIAGAFRQGKSFLLNFFIRYLTVTSRNRTNLRNWLIPDDGPVAGFCSRGGSDTVTSGILIWSEIFLSQLPSGEEIAVVLLDTQGAFDNETPLKNCAAIFALSTLISSVQIYNLKENIKSQDLEHLRFFLDYGKLLRDSGNQVPFQNLLFLVRDWPNSEEFSYGMEGGDRYLRKILNTKDRNVDEELIVLRRGITNLFERISCFLLPHPGLKVANQNFNGALDSIENSFKEQIEILASNVLSPKNLIPKVINGEFIRVKHLVNLFESYCEQFKSDKMPKVESIFMAAAHSQHAMAIEEAEVVYDKQMDFIKNKDLEGLEDELLQQEHCYSKNVAIDTFLKKKVIGSDEMKMMSKATLEKKLDERFKVYINLNEIKLQKEKEKKMQTMYEEQQYQICHLVEQIDEEKEKRQKMIEKHQESIVKQEVKIADLEHQVNEEKRMREVVVKENQESVKKQEEQILDLEKNLKGERKRMEKMKEEQNELLEEQRRQISRLEERLEEERTVAHFPGGILSEIDRADDPAAKVVKGVLSVGYGIASLADGAFGSIYRIFK